MALEKVPGGALGRGGIPAPLAPTGGLCPWSRVMGGRDPAGERVARMVDQPSLYWLRRQEAHRRTAQGRAKDARISILTTLIIPNRLYPTGARKRLPRLCRESECALNLACQVGRGRTWIGSPANRGVHLPKGRWPLAPINRALAQKTLRLGTRSAGVLYFQLLLDPLEQSST